MALRTMAALAVGLTTGLALQDVRLENPFGAPELVSAYETATQDKVVSGSFENASVKDVVKWLSENGVNFVLKDSSLGDARVSLNVKDQPLRQVADALATALGGRWEKNGEILVFKANAGEGAWEMPKIIDFKAIPDGPFAQMNAKDRAAMEKDMKRAHEEMAKAFGDAKVFQFKADGSAFDAKMSAKERAQMEKAMKRAQEEMAKAFGEAKVFQFKGDGPAFDAKMSDKERAAMQEGMKRSHEEMAKAFRLDSKEHEKMMKELHKEMGAARIEMQKAFSDKDMAKMDPKERAEMLKGLGEGLREMKIHLGEMGDLKGMGPEVHIEIERALQDAHKAMSESHKAMAEGQKAHKEIRISKMKGDGAHTWVMTGAKEGGFEKLYKGLSKVQLEKHKKQGYLKLSDLTEAQRKLVGIPTDAKNLTIKFKSNDGKEVTIKS